MMKSSLDRAAYDVESVSVSGSARNIDIGPESPRWSRHSAYTPMMSRPVAQRIFARR
ncbi:hypothetical protein AB0K16_18450 [Nonomuraea jabiensis]|uniref:hypothetical protein n=1 Tax=Nonomuraea jabiensis TaxID=882448 RepID=UPI00341F2F12